MDTDLESDNSEGNSPEPIFKSIINAMGSKKEATADQIYRRIQRDGVTNFSKPQVDRALANALQYGIFEVRNNRFRVSDDVLDDEDTIYWQAHIKREKTPYRLENNQREYINPEKDQHTFRRIYVSDGESCNSCKKQGGATNSSNVRKVRGHNQKSSFNSNKNVKDNCGQVQKMNAPKQRKMTVMKRQPVENKRAPVKRMAKNAKERDAKKRKKMSLDIQDNLHDRDEQESDSDESSKTVKWNKKRTARKGDDDVLECDDEEDFVLEDDAHQNNEEDCEDEDRYPSSSYFEYMKEPYASKFFSRTSRRNSPCGSGTAGLTGESDSTGLSNENRNWNITCKPSENLQGGTWCGKVDWLMNRPENTEVGTVKQFDNGLKIEPIDSLPFKNMEEPSYIS